MNADCDYCGAPGCHWSRHSQARVDVAVGRLEDAAAEFPFGDHRPEAEVDFD